MLLDLEGMGWRHCESEWDIVYGTGNRECDDVESRMRMMHRDPARVALLQITHVTATFQWRFTLFGTRYI